MLGDLLEPAWLVLQTEITLPDPIGTVTILEIDIFLFGFAIVVAFVGGIIYD